MKVMCLYTDCGPSYVRKGWGRVFAAMGHDFIFWIPQQKSPIDAFNELEPDLFIGTTYDLDRATAKCIAARPNMKVILFASAWGQLVKDIDKSQYPLVVTTDIEKKVLEDLKRKTGKPDFVFIHVTDKYLEGTMGGWREAGILPVGILNAADTFDYSAGRARPELLCDVGFVGGYWDYKARNLNRFLLPLCHLSKKLNVKIFGNQNWPVHQYLGTVSDQDARDLFVSATVCPNVSEPHSTDLGWDVIERPFKVLSSGGFCVSDYVEEAREIFTAMELPMAHTPKRFEELVMYFVDNPGSRNQHMEAGQKKVLTQHTYFERVEKMFSCLGMEDEASRVEEVKAKFVKVP